MITEPLAINGASRILSVDAEKHRYISEIVDVIGRTYDPQAGCQDIGFVKYACYVDLEREPGPTAVLRSSTFSHDFGVSFTHESIAVLWTDEVKIFGVRLTGPWHHALFRQGGHGESACITGHIKFADAVMFPPAVIPPTPAIT